MEFSVIQLKNGNVVCFDVDDSLVMWDMPYQETGTYVNVNYDGKDSMMLVHIKNVDNLIRFASRGYSVVVWSAGGSDWARAVVDALRINDYVSVVMDKPRYYFDDLPCTDWMGVWKDIKY